MVPSLFVSFCTFLLSLGSLNGFRHHHFHHESDLTHVTIPWATIIGRREEVLGHRLRVFLGVPYAEPPVGELRFKRTVPLGPSGDVDGAYDATKFQASCPQPPNSNHAYEQESENCLYLNIWTPFAGGDQRTGLGQNGIASNLKPVLFYIYGGGFDKGSVVERRHQGDVLAALGKVVVVTVNHRLNILGFGFGGTESMPGNMGAYDLIQALKWVNQNIEHFGGDPENVIIFGSCSGAMVASGFVLSPMVGTELFSKVYLASSIVSPHVAVRSPDLLFNLTRTVAEAVGCGNTNDPRARKFTEAQINCLKAANVKAMLNVSVTDKLLDQLSWKISPPFGLIYGTDLFPASPDHLVRDKKPERRIHMLVGNEEDEDEMLIASWPENKQIARELLTYVIKRSYPETDSNKIRRIYDYYFGAVEEGNKMAIKDALTNAAGDFLHHCPLLLFSEAWTRNGQIIHGYLNAYVMEGFNATQRSFGTKHGDATYQILGQAYHEHEKFTELDRRVTRKMIRILSDFAYDKKLPWPPMLINSAGQVLPLKWKWNRQMNPRNTRSDPKDDICHLWGEVRHYVVT